MKLYLLTQDENTGYDTYDSCVVCAENEDDAEKIHPDGSYLENSLRHKIYSRSWDNSLENIKIQYIGEAAQNIEKGVVIASFNAG